MESSYTELYADSFFPAASENKNGKKAPALTLPQLRILPETVLPMRTCDPDEITESVRGIRLRNHRAYLSHRNKTEELIL